MKIITLPYNPSITKEKVMEVLRKEYPGKKVSKFLNQVRIKENACRLAQVMITHKPKKNQTVITVSSNMPTWAAATIVILPIVFIGVGIYSMTGNWATEVTQVLNRHFN